MIELKEMQERLNQDFKSNDEFLELLKKDAETAEIITVSEFDRKRKRNRGVEYWNIPASLDTETTNIKSIKVAFVYIIQININGWSTYVRTWEEFGALLEEIRKILGLGNKRRLVIYIHNEGFEMSFMLPRFNNFQELFAISEHQPTRVTTWDGFQFRDSLKLSGLSLAETANNLTLFKIKKMTGDLDYSKMRNSFTPLTKKELKYCLHDVTTLTAYIYEQIKLYGDITNIPMTNTGRVRRYVLEHTRNSDDLEQNQNYSDIINSLTLEPEEYKMLKLGFMGGYTHASHNKVNKVLKKVHSYDFTSSYPTIICSEKFPMSKGELVYYVSPDDYNRDKKNYCILSYVEITELNEKFGCEHYISRSKCLETEGAVCDNGRVVCADKISGVFTDCDIDIIKATYTGHMKILKSYRYKKDYLPKALINCVLHFYESKTTLKGVKGKEAEYMLLKGMLNSIYGMMVTDIVQPETLWSIKEEHNAGWSTASVNLEDAINKYNRSTKRTTFYAWGVWITAYARRNLWSGIMELKDDYIYSDTDSVKFQNLKAHQSYFDNYNKDIKAKIKAVCDLYGIDASKAEPKTIKGKKKPLGVWDYEGYYEKFKTLGAKRYMVRQRGKYYITIAGVSKGANKYIAKIQQKRNPFDFFSDDMVIPSEWSGKQAVAYEQHEQYMSHIVIDDYGNKEEMVEFGSAYIYETEYHLNMVQNYLDYLKYGTNGIKDLATLENSLKALAGA